jgi:hypothetical protein
MLARHDRERSDVRRQREGGEEHVVLAPEVDRQIDADVARDAIDLGARAGGDRARGGDLGDGALERVERHERLHVVAAQVGRHGVGRGGGDSPGASEHGAGHGVILLFDRSRRSTGGYHARARRAVTSVTCLRA